MFLHVDPVVGFQSARGEIFLSAQRHLPLLRHLIDLALPDATVKMKLLTSLNHEEQQSDSAMLGFPV